jgi:hypothetical protein
MAGFYRVFIDGKPFRRVRKPVHEAIEAPTLTTQGIFERV